MMRSHSNTIAYAAVLTAAGLILGYIESLIPLPIHVPGVRIGIANIVTLISLMLKGPLFAAAVLVLRVMMSAVLFGTPVSFIYSMSGALTALLGMCFMKRLGFSVYGISVTGAVLHNLAQILAALFIVGSRYIMVYLPVLTVAGIFAGLAVGLLADILISRLAVFIKDDEIRKERE